LLGKAAAPTWLGVANLVPQSIGAVLVTCTHIIIRLAISQCLSLPAYIDLSYYYIPLYMIYIYIYSILYHYNYFPLYHLVAARFQVCQAFPELSWGVVTPCWVRGRQPRGWEGGLHLLAMPAPFKYESRFNLVSAPIKALF
jgi:hypothetical protein